MPVETRSGTRAKQAIKEGGVLAFIKNAPEVSRRENLKNFVKEWHKDIAVPCDWLEHETSLSKGAKEVMEMWREPGNMVQCLSEVEPPTPRNTQLSEFQRRRLLPHDYKYERGITNYEQVSLCRGFDERGRIIMKTGHNPHYQPPHGTYKKYIVSRIRYNSKGNPVWSIKPNPDYDPETPNTSTNSCHKPGRVLLPWLMANYALRNGAVEINTEEERVRLVEQMQDGPGYSVALSSLPPCPVKKPRGKPKPRVIIRCSNNTGGRRKRSDDILHQTQGDYRVEKKRSSP
jgi:hypothetical protein